MAQGANSGSKKRTVEVPPDPIIPDKLYFRIGEVARLLSLPPYVLRFWEGEFPQLRPGKAATGQRMYRRRDLEVAMRIKRLLYVEGYTIPGARQALKVEVRQLPLNLTDPDPDRLRLRQVRSELKEIASLLARPTSPVRHPSEESAE